VNEPDPETGVPRPVAIGDAKPSPLGNFKFNPKRGGGRLDKVPVARDVFRRNYVRASHFGEVNTYYHLDRIAAYVHELLEELGAPRLPRVTAVVNAHHAATEREGGIRDGAWRSGRWLPFQGGHYRLPSRRYDVREYDPISPDGEIHLGPGWQLLEHGALVEFTGRRYRSNASHNAGILYHEYGHHLCRYTADFRGNAIRRPHRQNNRKSALEEGVCDYWAATMLGTPHIWAFHHRHDGEQVHPRSLTSRKTMAEFDSRPGADPHANGTIWGAALWDLRSGLGAAHPDGARQTDLLVVMALLLIGRLDDPYQEASVARVWRARSGYATALGALLRADELLHGGRNLGRIWSAFSGRGIRAESHDLGERTAVTTPV
jgi:hypothetical protein